MLTQHTDRAGCVRTVSVTIDANGVRHERDVLTRQGRKEWARRVEAVRKRAAARAAELDLIEKEGAR